jgi:hypothetical protein
MSSATHQVLSDAVTRATERLEKRGDEVQNRALTRASHELQMALFPPAVQGPDKLDYAANYDHALQDYHTRLLAEGEAKAPAIAHEVRQKFLARNQDLADNNFQVLNNRLGSAKLKVDANGDVDQDSLAAAANSAYTRFNMGTPEKRAAAKRTGTWPKELDDALHLIQEADEAAQLKKLWKDQSRTIKEGGKPQ